MARGLRRGPVLLRFRSLVDSVAHYVAGIVDTRQLSKSDTRLLPQCASIFRQDSSLLQFQKFQTNNLSSTFGVREIVDSQISSTAMTISPSCPASPTGSERCKWLQHFQIFDARDHPRRFTLFQLRGGPLRPLPDDYQKRHHALSP